MIKQGYAGALAVACTVLMSAAALAGPDAINQKSQGSEREQLQAATVWVEANAARLVLPVGLRSTDETGAVVHGHSRIVVAEAPVIVGKLNYDCNFAVAVFGLGGTPADVIADPEKPIIIKRPGQAVPDGDYHVVELQTEHALLFTVMAVDTTTVTAERENVVINGDAGSVVQL